MRCAFALFAVMLGVVFAGTHKVPPGEGMALVDVPDKWETREKGELVESISPDGAVYFLIIPVEHRKVAESIGEALRYLRGRGNIVIDPNSREHKPGKVKDVAADFISWKGKNKTGPVEIKFVTFAVEADEPVVAAWWGAPDAIKKHQSEIDKILRTVRKGAEAKSEDRQ